MRYSESKETVIGEEVVGDELGKIIVPQFGAPVGKLYACQYWIFV
jgi:hypothetical protein